MNTRESIKASIDLGKMISTSYLGDLSDEELMKRPHPQCNHIKWQVGHLISSENQMINGVMPGSMPELPAGFAGKYTKETATINDGAFFHSKVELLNVFEQQRSATLKALEICTDTDLDKPSPESMQSYAPNVGAAFALQNSHWLMHAGQWAVVRRQLGRPPLF